MRRRREWVKYMSGGGSEFGLLRGGQTGEGVVEIGLLLGHIRKGDPELLNLTCQDLFLPGGGGGKQGREEGEGGGG